IIFTHADLAGFQEAFEEIKEIFGPIEPLIKSGPIGAGKDKGGPIEPVLNYFFLDNKNVNSSSYDFLFALIAKKFQEMTLEAPILLERQKHCLRELLEK